MKFFERYIAKIETIEDIKLLSYNIIHDRTNITYLRFKVKCKINKINMNVTYDGLLLVKNNNIYTGFDKSKYNPLQFKNSYSTAKNMKCKSWPFTYYKSDEAMDDIIRAVILKIEESDYDFKLR